MIRAESTEHNIRPKDAQILERGINNYNAVNEQKAFPRAYVPLI